MAFCEQLFERSKTRIQWMATRINDFGIWQDEMQKADMWEVIRHLVRKVWSALAMMHRAVDIVFAKRGNVSFVEVDDRRRILETIESIQTRLKPKQ